MTSASWINDGNTISAQVDPAHPSYIAPVCFLDDDWSPEIVAANARLIAAAPELLAVLRSIEAKADYGKDNPRRQTDILFDILELARDAIEKATGEQA